ncbi:SUMF1/EgtB/PvdOfamily nonheme iron enzyme [Anabaena sp. UHCC 0253]|uniref:SUMF1/EgtB/PvdO family nonheme iron enzyme n=1 Tax=Anabaena sp. UHCC 0253 TaxID=2590019 RepID=UPI001447056D|nr:SUMF1/EgtB/PvdO family nonheme iron enzyme [Anabaena sp. UHCC 0253]MTJ55631.1 SUMF1/EgtB/PvdOfamily nonheme iron enzyme [Anabaena sp. UHCC 0253]
MKNPSLLNLFLELRATGLPLTIDQYDLALMALSKSVDIVLNDDKPAIKGVLQTVWVKSRKQQALFNQCWQEFNQKYPSQTAKVENQADVIEVKPEIQKPEIEKIPQPALINDESELQQPAAEIAQFNPDLHDDHGVGTSVKTKLKEVYYLPISRQKLQGSWQLLIQELTGNVRQIDIPNTVIDITKHGFFTQAVFTYPKTKYREVVLLIDQGGSMTPFHPLCRQLQQVYQTAKVYYFHNSPTDELYHDPQCWQGQSLTSILSKFSPQQTLVIIISDAGAARGRTVPDRWEETYDFLEKLIPKAKKIAWLNPLPRFRWLDNTAEEIAKINSAVPMFALETGEFQAMVKWLLGDKAKQYKKENVETFHGTSLQQDNNDNLWDYGFDAKGKIKVFEKLLGKSHLKFASYAAFPLVLTPDLLYCLYRKFFFKTSGEKSSLPWYVVADLLLSDLCQQVDFELYEMEREVRNELLKKLPKRNRKQVLKELSDFLIQYINRQVSHQNQNNDLNQVQEWAALSYVDKGSQAAKELAQKLQEAYFSHNKGELVRLSSVIETLAEPLKTDYEPLLKIAQGYRAVARGDDNGVEEIRKIFNLETIEVGGVKLKRPEINFGKVRLQLFNFPVITVNRRGKEIQKETKQNYYFQESLLGNITLDMVAIPGGKFLMGSQENEEGRYGDESPQHEVTVQPFFMGKYPVTQAQWEAVATKCPQVNRELEPNPSHFKENKQENNLPVESITWYDAVEFCERLSRLTGKQYRLPSEAEWEYACRAGTTTPFHFGETITGKLANYRASTVYGEEPEGEYREKTIPVGSFTANAFGLYDMHGNVWEWCDDHWHDGYDNAPADGSAWIESNSVEEDKRRLLRGGSWLDRPRSCRSAFRSHHDPDYRNTSRGFRLVVSGARTL